MPETDTLHLGEQYYIVADGERSAAPRVLKHGDTFAVFDPHGDIVPAEAGEQGIYHGGTRFLSRFELTMGHGRPFLLNSTTSDDNVLFSADMTNRDVFRGETLVLARGEIHVYRARVLRDGGVCERLRVSNHARQRVEVPLTLRFDADFADIFEVRGARRPVRGIRLPDVPVHQAREHGEESAALPVAIALGYRGLDGVERRTRLEWNRAPSVVADRSVSFVVSLEPHTSDDLELAVVLEAADAHGASVAVPAGTAASASNRHAVSASPRRGLDFEAALLAGRERGRSPAGAATVTSSNEVFNRWMRRSMADLRMMTSETPHGAYPYAGIPWFSTPFGRDGLLTALEVLWLDPALARGVLAFLADAQATSHVDAQDAQPGKILHEMRNGEMAALGEVPFGRYYGSADATPLFVLLADRYVERTGDLAFADALWPHIVAALGWMETDGDPDGDGFIEYARRQATGLVHQGWKDSNDAVFHADGTLASPPIALCEIQGYAYAAWRGASRLATARGDMALAGQWYERAERLRARFDAAFWCEELGTYALALDGDKRPCRVRTSNPGHCLLTGIVPGEHAERLAATLMSDRSFAGWGIRTVASGEARYNPMSYHNGSIWPHDNALVAAGLARYGHTVRATRVLSAMFDLSQAMDLHRLPELICGFERHASESPTLYPVACAPQAWAAGAVFLLLEAALGLQIDARARRVTFARAALPDTLDWLRISGLRVGEGSLDLLLERHPRDVGVTVLQREGDIEIVSVK
ncbi:MAG: amylo-alpha-1,6-glucosidase [Vicinamibacteraceae bacterium]|nr:amylo-alpha-1,6-glucosidase [Vicinamibacteraceae bacterium]